MTLGLILVFFGFQEANSLASGFSRVFYNTPTDQALWFLVGGGTAVALGLYITMSRI
jgi:hypothetical protein